MWTLLHPRMTMDRLGYIPYQILADDPRDIRAQINDRYGFAGGWRPGSFSKMRLDLETGNATYPGDPVFKPLAKFTHDDETFYYYDSSIVAVVQKDGSYEFSRMD